MKINKLFNSVNDVMSDVFDGAVIMLGGFGEAGSPVELIPVSYTHLTLPTICSV